MKKNLLSIIILALVIVNLVLTGIMMFSVVNASFKTSAIVTEIASILKLEIETSEAANTKEEAVDLANVETFPLAQMTIPLKDSVVMQQAADGSMTPISDGNTHYALISMTLAMNTKDESYEQYAEKMDAMSDLVKDDIIRTVGEYTIEDIADISSRDEIQDIVLKKIQELFNSKFIYKVAITDIKYQ